MEDSREARSFEKILEEKPDLSELSEQVVTDNWYLLGVHLKCETSKLDELEEMNGNNEYKTFKMFQHWLETNTNATRRHVIEALKKRVIGENALAEDYLKKLQNSNCKFKKLMCWATCSFWHCACSYRGKIDVAARIVLLSVGGHVLCFQIGAYGFDVFVQCSPICYLLYYR